MNVDEIITLDDNKEYILLSKTVHNNDKYFLAVEAVKDKPTNNYVIFKEINENGEFFVEEIVDKTLIDTLVDIFEQLYDEEDIESED